MIRALFHLLQWMLPPARRRRYGREMANVFETLVAEERRAQGAAGVARLLFREAAGLSRFAARDWLRRVGVRARARGIRPRVASDLHWAWRGVRARGWRVPLIVGLIGTTLGANAVVFSVADSFIFNPFPYQAPERIVSMTHSAAAPEQVVLPHSAALLSAWSTQRDLVAAAGGYLRKGGIFLLSPDSAERVFGADITVGLLDVLGVQPRWGRSFVDSDLRETGGHAALLREDLARRRFGQPDRAVGQRLDATGGPLLIVGVMSSDFAFPRADTQVWRALDPSGPLARNFEATPLLVRLRSGEPVDTASASIAARARMVGQAVGLASYGVEVQPFAVHRNPAARGAMLWVLLGAALCLVLSSCANVASLELAQVLRRARSFGVQLALGASRGSLVRVVMLEGLCIVGCALAVGLGLAWILTTLVRDLIPEAIRITSQNPIALEIRAISYAAAVAGVTWLLVAAPPIVSVWRGGVSKVLTFGGRATTESRRGATIRRALTVIQVGLAVTLAVVGLQYARSYRNLLALEKGFDTNGVALLTALVPNYYFGTNASRLAFVDRLLGALRTEPGVVAAAEGPAPPHMGDTPSRISPIVDGQPTAGEVLLGRNWIDPAYFAVTKLPLLAGRYLEPGDPPDHAVVTDVFARRFWPDVSPIGRQFSGGPGSSLPEPFTVVGVVGGFRTNPRRLPSPTDNRMYFYVLLRRPAAAPAPPQPAPVARVDAGGSYGILTVMVRLDRPERLAAVRALAQSFDPKLQVTASLIDEIYAQPNADVRLTSAVVRLFSGLAFVIAMAGLYAVIAFLVASRTREIGVRMALGADRAAIRRMVLVSSGRLALAGVALGALVAVGAARWIESQLFGVSMVDPATYLGVCAAVVSTALLATWYPARQAARIDPAVTLRAE